MSLDTSRFGFGITGKVPHEIVRELAPLVEQAGFRTMWFNHIPRGDALASIAIAAAVTSRIRLASGVTSVDSQMSALDVVQSVRDHDLPLDRLVLGIGANKPPSPLKTVTEAVSLIHDELPGVPVAVGALGPRMRCLGVTSADGLLLNWLTPDAARQAMHDARTDAGDHEPFVALYIRTALGDSAQVAMEEEIERYSNFPSYAANFKRLGHSAADAAVRVDSPEALQTSLSRYVGTVTEPVLRAITGEESLDAYVQLLEASLH